MRTKFKVFLTSLLLTFTLNLSKESSFNFNVPYSQNTFFIDMEGICQDD